MNYGNDAYTKIKALNDHITNWKLTNEKNGTGRDWTIEDTIGWLAQQFSVPEGAVGRSIEEQAQARADTVAPMTTAEDWSRVALWLALVRSQWLRLTHVPTNLHSRWSVFRCSFRRH